MFSSSPEYYCWQKKFTYMYTYFFNPYKHAVDLAIFNSLLSTIIFDGTEVSKTQELISFSTFNIITIIFFFERSQRLSLIALAMMTMD